MTSTSTTVNSQLVITDHRGEVFTYESTAEDPWEAKDFSDQFWSKIHSIQELRDGEPQDISRFEDEDIHWDHGHQCLYARQWRIHMNGERVQDASNTRPEQYDVEGLAMQLKAKNKSKFEVLDQDDEVVDSWIWIKKAQELVECVED